MDALLAWLKEQAMEAHNRSESAVSPEYMIGQYAQEKAYTRVIAKIENSRVCQRPHVPKGWDEI